MILQELHHIQSRCGYLPLNELRALAARIKVPLHRINEVASFYPHYRLQPPPAVDVKVCRDMACHLRGANLLQRSLEAIAQEHGHGQVCVQGVSCLGQCDQPVAVSINDHVYRGLSEVGIRQRIQQAAAKEPLLPQKADRTPPAWKIDPYRGQPRYDALRHFIGQRDADGVIAALEVADLRGMGGAGFRTHLKWSSVRNTPSDVKYVICNADESEPGTFKDRELLRRAPYLVIEGLVLAGLVTGAGRGYIYIRHEFEEEIQALREALDWAERGRLCGENILGSGISFPIEIFISPGGYIQGEESALLEAMEDRRGEPRNKPPFPVTHGLFGKPTVINNVETLAWVPSILLHGVQWYRDQGTNGATGLRLVSVSGDVNRPGVYEVPFGQTVRELINDLAGGLRDGQGLKAIAPSGPSSGFLPAKIEVESLPKPFVERMLKENRLRMNAKLFDILDLPLDFNTLGAMGSMLGAAFFVVGDRADIVDLALNCVEFYRNESCGKCVPCRVGSQKLVEVLHEIVAGRFPKNHLASIPELAETMSLTSICGLGQVAANPITSVLKYFRKDLDKYLERTL